VDNVLDKVRKLLRLSKSSNANEAALAAAKAQELIDRHQLAQAMLTLDDTNPTKGLDDEPIVNFSDAPLDTPKQLDRWRGALAIAIGQWNACKIWAVGPNLMIVGRPSDAETVRYLYGWLSNEVERLATEQGQGKGRTWRNNFRLGVVDTIARKLREQHEAFKKTVRAEAETTQALVRVDQSLARIVERKMEVYRWVKDNMKLYQRSGGRSNYDHGARNAGRRAGESITVGNAQRGLTSAARRLGA
jgi:hypothetical protein